MGRLLGSGSFGRASARVMIALGAVGLVALLAAGCEKGSQFALCKTNADCGIGKDGKPSKVCFDSRCVECHYDGDCSPGKVCNTTGQCKSIDGRSGPEPGSGFEDGGAPPPEAPPAEAPQP